MSELPDPVQAADPGAPAVAVADDLPVIRVAMPAEPLWQWLIDSGTYAAWSQEHGMAIEVSHPFRPFSALVSDAADVILINALDIPVFSSGFEQRPVIIGKYAYDRSLAATKRTSQANDLATHVEGKVAVETELGSTLLWALIVNEAHGLDLSSGSSDFDLFVATFGLAAAVENDDAVACICQPDQSAAGFSGAILRAMYDSTPAAQLYAALTGTPDQLLLGQVWLADQDWLGEQPTAAPALLELWEQAVQHWSSNSAEVISAYPELLSLQTDQEVTWLTDYVRANDWIAPTVYLTQGDADAYSKALARLRELGILELESPVPPVATDLSSLSSSALAGE